MKKRLLKHYVLTLTLLILCSLGGRAQIYVSPGGNDGNDGSSGSPKLTIQAAIDASVAGDIVYISPGTYSPIGQLPEYGSFINANKQVTLEGTGVSKGDVIIDGLTNYVTTFNRGIFISANGVGIKNLTVTNFESGIAQANDVIGLTLDNIASNANYRYGFYTNRSATDVSITNSEFNNNGNKDGIPIGSSARGIMFQSSDANFSNILVNQNTVSDNQLVGIDFAESLYSSGIVITNNTVERNGDSGIGLWLGNNDLNSAATIVSGNTITMKDNQRFGIEIKNVLASGANSGAGSVVIDDNTISQTGIPTNSRDFAAIAVLRRKSGYTNINDQPFGVYIVNNHISNIASASGDGYGVVVGGTGHTILGNNITGTDVAIQLQKGNIGFNGNSDSPSTTGDANTFYFDRDNSEDVCAYIGTNALTLNGTDLRYVTGSSTASNAAPELVAQNTNTLVQFCSIQSAINAPSSLDGNTINVNAGTHLTSGIVINKSISLIGNNNDLANKPLITGGFVTNRALIYVSAPNITISNLHLQFQETDFNSAPPTASYGIKSGPTGTFNNLTLTDNLIEGTNPGYVFNSAAIFLGVINTNGNDKVTILRNKVGHTESNNALGRAIRSSNIYGNIEENNLKAHYAAIQAGDSRGGALIINDNIIQGKLAMNGYVNPGNKITSNTITSGGTADANQGQTGADRQPALIEVISTTNPLATVEISGNTLNDFKMFGIGVFYSSNVSVINNILNPLLGSSNTVGLYFDTKTTNTGTPGAKAFQNLIVKQNTFNAPTNSGTNNIGIKFANSYSDNALAPLSGAIIGGVGTEANIFDEALNEYIRLDDRPAGTTIGDFIWSSTYYSGTAETNILPFAANIVAEFNKYGSIDTRISRDPVSLADVKVKIHDKDDNVGLGEVILNFPIRNSDTQEGFATIQEAIDDTDTQNGHTINVDEGTYTLTQSITINKSVTLQGNQNLAIKPVINGTGSTTGGKALIALDAPNIKIKNFELQIAQANDALVGIGSLSNENFNNLEISNNVFKGTKTDLSQMFAFDSYAIKLGTHLTAVKNNVKITGNTVTYSSLSAPVLFGRGIYAYNVSGTIGGSLAEANDITALYALQSGVIGDNGASFDFSYNTIPLGMISIIGADKGVHTIQHNDIGNDIPNAAISKQFIRMVEVRGSRNADAEIIVANNKINNFSNIGLFIQRSDNITIKDNTFNPFNDALNTNFTGIVFSSKEGTAGTQSPVTSKNLNITGNIFNAPQAGGMGVAFFNHNAAANIIPLTNAKIGGSGALKNTFHTNLGQYIFMDVSSGTSNGTFSGTTYDALYDVTQLVENTTDVLPFNGDIDASYNIFGDFDSEIETVFDNLVAIKSKITDGIDQNGLGYVNIQPAKAFISSVQNLEMGLVAVPEDFTLVIKNDNTLYDALGDATVTKANTFAIDGNTTAVLEFANFTANAANKEIKFTNAVNVAGAFTLSAGKITPSSTFTLNGSVNTTNGITNFINGEVTIKNVGSDLLIPVGKGNKAAYIALTNAAGNPSSFTAEYFPAAHVNLAKEGTLASVSNNEYWSLNRTSGDLQAKVKLYTFDLESSGMEDVPLAEAVVSWYNTANTQWETNGGTHSAAAPQYDVTATIDNTLFGSFTFGSTATPLPVTLTNFTAKPTIEGALLSWSTSAEVSNDKFIIEKSLDGKTFSQLTEVVAKGSGNYAYIDRTLAASAYYRLVQVDQDGKTTVYDDLIRYVNVGKEGISVYPNPTASFVHINLNRNANDKVSVNVTDGLGKQINDIVEKGEQVIKVDLQSQKPGIYLIQLIKNNDVSYHKVVKQ